MESRVQELLARHPRLNTVAEALEVIPVSRELFYLKLRNGELPARRFGRRILVDVAEVLEVMRNGDQK